jgi:hypothetical protein
MRGLPEQFPARGGTEGAVFTGRAQEKVTVRAAIRRRDAEGSTCPRTVRQSRVVAQWYFCCHDAWAGPFSLKYRGYFPYSAKLCRNGSEYARAMAARAGIGLTPPDNGFAAVDDANAVQKTCGSLYENVIRDLAAKWIALLPCPLTREGTAAGYRYEVPVLQAGFSLTRVLDKASDRADLLRAGHPRQPGHRTAPQRGADLRAADHPQGTAGHPGPVPHPDPHPGFANRDLRPIPAQLPGLPARTITPGEMTCDLRRPRIHGLIERIPGTFRHEAADTGIARALFLTRLHGRFLRTGLAARASPAGKNRDLAAASRACATAIDDLARQAGLAA